jgi:hypothetical protein
MAKLIPSLGSTFQRKVQALKRGILLLEIISIMREKNIAVISYRYIPRILRKTV